jgi:L-asparaginase
MSASAQPQARPVRLLAAGGTISMQGDAGAVPALSADQLVAAVPQLARFTQLSAENLLSLPGPQISLTQALELATRAAHVAEGGDGVVITTGTDTLEELAMLCALIHDADAPIVITGANRPASAVGADGPANLLDAITLAAAPQAENLGVVVAFGGEIHAATSARKFDSTGPAAFGSPVAGPIGRIVEGRVWLHATPLPTPTIRPTSLQFEVPIVTAALGEDAHPLRAASGTADGLVVSAFGAGHLTPRMLHAMREAVTRIPVAVTVRPERGSMLHATYGFEGSEQDLRATQALFVPFLSAVAARIALLCCLGAGLDHQAAAAALAPWDA